MMAGQTVFNELKYNINEETGRAQVAAFSPLEQGPEVAVIAEEVEYDGKKISITR